MNLRHDVLAIDNNRFGFGGSQCDMQNRSVFGHVDPLAREHVFDFVSEANVLGERDKLAALYASGTARQDMRKEKTALIEALRERYRALAAEWPIDPYRGWIEAPINNAKLANVATYHEHVPAFRAMHLEAGTLAAFFARVEALAELSYSERTARLEALVAGPGRVTAVQSALRDD